jgi:hypothetical protein
VQCVGTEIQGVIVGKCDAAHAHLRKPLGSHRRSAKEESLAGVADALPAIRDAALEVQDEQVGAPRDRLELAGQQSVARTREAHRDLPAEHRVARECDREGHGKTVRARLGSGPRPSSRARRRRESRRPKCSYTRPRPCAQHVVERHADGLVFSTSMAGGWSCLRTRWRFVTAARLAWTRPSARAGTRTGVEMPRIVITSTLG